MINLIGLGLEINDISVKSLEIIKNAEKVYLESYTSVFPFEVVELEKLIGKKIILADRDFVESATELINEGKDKNIVLIVYGDPLMATTHLSLIEQAKKENVEINIKHNCSIFNAITNTGLEAYKFGKVTSIPKWSENYKPTSFYKIYKENKSINAHTLFLLDIGLAVNDAINYLLESSKKDIDELITEDTFIVVCSLLGTSKENIVYSKISELKDSKFDHPVCLIIPSKMHFVEENFLSNFRFS